MRHHCMYALMREHTCAGSAITRMLRGSAACDRMKKRESDSDSNVTVCMDGDDDDSLTSLTDSDESVGLVAYR